MWLGIKSNDLCEGNYIKIMNDFEWLCYIVTHKKEVKLWNGGKGFIHIANIWNQDKMHVSSGYQKRKPHLQYRKQGRMIHPYALPFD